MRLLRRFAPAGVLDAGVRKDLRLDAVAHATHRPVDATRDRVHSSKETMKALTFKRYGKSPEIGFADVPRPRSRPTNCWFRSTLPA
jgi:hypothetical protein